MFTIPVLQLRPHSRPVRSQSLYRLDYRGCVERYRIPTDAQSVSLHQRTLSERDSSAEREVIRPTANVTPTVHQHGPTTDNPPIVRYEVFTAVTMKNGIFWDVTPCDTCKNRRFGGT
jgi:hypothetical protein